MSPLFTGFPAIIYSGLWFLQKIGILEREIPNVKIVCLITDAPSAIMIIINEGNFEIKLLNDVKTTADLTKISCDMFIALPSNYFLGSVDGILEGISKGIIQIKNENILIILGKIASVF